MLNCSVAISLHSQSICVGSVNDTLLKLSCRFYIKVFGPIFSDLKIDIFVKIYHFKREDSKIDPAFVQ